MALLLRWYSPHKNLDMVRSKGKHSGYDLVDPDTGWTCEVKADWVSCQTGNYAVEYRFGGNPSGIAVTTADAWVFWDGLVLCITTMDQLMDAIRERSFTKHWVGPGDKKRKWCMMVEKGVMQRHGYCIRPLR